MPVSGIPNQVGVVMEMARVDPKSEILFLEWVVDLFKAREETWPVGRWIVTTMKEGIMQASEAFALDGTVPTYANGG